jgi:hypothetical protein
MDDRGVSEVVGFVLVFSVITMTIGIVSVVGLGGLQDAQQAEQVNNVERAFDVFATNADEIHRNDAPSRSTEMRLAGGTLTYGDPVTVTIDAGEQDPREFDTRPLVYRNAETEIVYELGGIIRTDGEHSVLLSGPPSVVSDRSTVPILVTTTPGDQDSIDGHRTVLVSSTHQRTDFVQQPTDQPVAITIESPRADAWERHFERPESQHLEVTSTDENSVTFEIDADGTSVSVTWIRLRFR